MSDEDILNTNFFANVPPPAKRGPKSGSRAGRKSKHFTEDKVAALVSNPGKWMILAEGVTVNENSNMIAWTRRHEGFKTVCRKLPDNPPDAPLTVFAVYQEMKTEEESD